MAVQYELAEQKRVYAKWAPIYDGIYRGLLADAQRRIATAAAACGPDILEIGVGTGLVLPYYPARSRVVGVDLSVDMLRKAFAKLGNGALGHVRLLAAMDACRLGFPDARFDAVTVPFVITLVPDPERALDEIRRVLRPGGEIVIASKLSRGAGLASRVEKAIAPLVRKIGWSSAFRIGRLEAWAARQPDMALVEVAPVFPAGFFKLVRIRRAAGPA